GWRVRHPSSATPRTAFYLDDPDEGIAVRVLSNSAMPGAVDAGGLTPILIRQMREHYPDFSLSAVSARRLPEGGEQTDFSALWTNQWGQRMRAKGMIVSARRGPDTVYAYVAGQAQELAFPGFEPILDRLLRR